MTGVEFHPQALFDLDEIWEFIRADNVDAADGMIAEILASIRALVPFTGQGRRRPDLTSRPLRFILVREGRNAVVGCRGDAWEAQPPRHGGNSQRQRVTEESIAVPCSVNA